MLPLRTSPASIHGKKGLFSFHGIIIALETINHKIFIAMTKKEGGSGIISYINLDRWFGFIKVEGRDKDLFFLGADVVEDIMPFDQLKKGMKVRFGHTEESKRGDLAKEVVMATS